MLLTEIKYQLLRNKGRSLLLFLIGAFLLGCTTLYLGNIQSSRQALDTLAQWLPVTMRVTNFDGSLISGLCIEADKLDELLTLDITDPVYTATATGAFSEADKEKAATADSSYQGGDVAIMAVNCAGALELDEEFSFLAGDDPVCAVEESFARANGLDVGDEISMPLFLRRWYVGTFSTQPQSFCMRLGEEETTLKIGGIFTASGVSRSVTMAVPVRWIRSKTESEGKSFACDSFYASPREPLQLNALKQQVEALGYQELNPYETDADSAAGDRVVFEDELFIKAAGKLRQSLNVYRAFLVPFFGLLVCLSALSVFLVLRNSRREMAISVSVGQEKAAVGLSRFFSVLLVDLAGCVVAFPVMIFGGGLACLDALVLCGLFLLCSCGGAAVALLLLLRFDAMTLLTKAD